MRGPTPAPDWLMTDSQRSPVIATGQSRAVYLKKVCAYVCVKKCVRERVGVRVSEM